MRQLAGDGAVAVTGGGNGVFRHTAMEQALAGRFAPEAVAQVATPQGDIAEGLMLHSVLGAHVDRCVVTSTKSMTGHLLGGAGALEALATVLALHHRTSPPTINLDDRDPAAFDQPVDVVAALDRHDVTRA